MATASAARVWDGPTRVFHWLLVLLVAISWRTGETGALEWHLWSGYAILALLLFRLGWGVVGSDTARFASFVRGPRAILRYLRASEPGPPGHNPLGALSVVAMLLLLLAQVGLGLFAVDEDGLESGPLSYLVSYEASERAADLHELAFNVLLAMIALHLLAILFYAAVRRRDLVRPMITGRAPVIAAAEPLRFSSWLRAALVLLAAGGVTWWIASGLRFF